ncbi:MAG TPA: hypothetical protein VM686_05430 [Polyangiaceae bacterium]|nr:hypothetical protein [Polyangiaceae bacterium]
MKPRAVAAIERLVASLALAHQLHEVEAGYTLAQIETTAPKRTVVIGSEVV